MNTTLPANQLDPHTMASADLMSFIHTGASNPTVVAKYEAELLEISMQIIKGDLSPLEKVLSDQAMTLNVLFTRYSISADTHAAEGHVIEAEKYQKLALQCSDKAMKIIKQLADMKKPKNGSVYIRTLNSQVNN